ncbi:MAG: ethanolamine utilization protein EutJ [Anaerolineales bacterium]|nr:ethanolamine utilization protein EutJ [Anaerolineales bacterium]
MNPNLTDLLERTERAMNGGASDLQYRGAVHVGVDLGTAYTTLLVLDENYQPLVGEYQFAQVTRDGLVVDYIGAVDLLRGMKERIERTLGFALTSASTAYPPGVPQAERRATANVLRGAELDCISLIDEPSAANNALQIRDGAIVDVGGGTTGVAVFRAGEAIYTADEATGGTHFSLVIAGASGLTFEEAEALKTNPDEQARLFPVVRPVMEKVATIVERHIAGWNVERIYLVGGACAFPGMGEVIQEMTGIETILPSRPLFVTPLGIAMNHRSVMPVE